MTPFLDQSILSTGYTPEMLMSAGVKIPNLLAGELGYSDLFVAGISTSD